MFSEHESDKKKSAGSPDNEQSQTIYFYTFRSREGIAAIAINIGTDPQVVAIQGFDEQEASFELYDYRGIVISEGVNQPDRENFTLLPGGILVLRQGMSIPPK